MRIREIWMKNFGRFADRRITVNDGIQLFYGENEAGKSTIYTFLKGMLFGMERKRGRASATDESHLYEPWENPNYYAGVLRFEAGGKTFCLQRSFEKTGRKAELFCEEDGEEFSVENGDLEMLLDGLTASGYENTISCGQLKVTPDASLGTELRNYATNACAQDKGDIDLGVAFARLKERKKDIERRIKIRLEERQKKQEITEQEASYVWTDIHKYTEEKSRISEELALREMGKQKNKKDSLAYTEEVSKWRIHPMELIVFVLLIISPLFIVSKPWNYLMAIIIFLCCLIYIWNRMKVSKRKEKTEPEILLEKIRPEEEKATREKLLWEQNRIEAELKEKQTQYENLKEQLEELDLTDDVIERLQQTRDAVTMAYEQLEALSGRLREQTDKLLNGRVSEIVCAFTGGKYERLFVDEDTRIYLITEDRKIRIEQVSRGTAEQIYLALRIAAAEFLYEEEFPLILDDTFGFYDEKRLANTLQWLAENKKQVLIFTCQKREEELLKKMHIPYNKENV